MKNIVEVKSLNPLSVYILCKAHYKHERFEGRNGPEWGYKYSENIANRMLLDLQMSGEAFISRHDSTNGELIKFVRIYNYRKNK